MESIKAIRKSTGLSQKRFADSFGIPVRTLQQWEQGASSPAPYVLNMLAQAVERRTGTNKSDARHHIPKKSTWKICIPDPFENCEKIYPIQQRKVRELIDDISSKDGVRQIVVFGSSVTESCHMGSDVDVFVESDCPDNLVTRAHDFEFDLWTNNTVDDRLRQEIEAKGVKVYG